MKRWVVTGGAGFIGSAFCRRALSLGWADEVVVLDAFTYAGNADNLAPIAHHPGLKIVRGDICQTEDIELALKDGVDALFHFAAESHVDRSIAGAEAFVTTNVVGTQTLLDAARRRGVGRFVHVSTDEVYGSLPLDTPERFVETTPLDPTSPYSASKAGSDLLVQATVRTHKLDAVITRCSNNYGPYQFTEKFIPLFITHALQGEPLPLYGDGKNVRDWIWVDDHVDGIYLAFLKGEPGGVYNLGGECERSNNSIAHQIVKLCGADEGLITPVVDRLAHDRRYAIDCKRAREVLGFVPGPAIEQRLPELVAWYQAHTAWWQRVNTGAYRQNQPLVRSKTTQASAQAHNAAL